MPSKETEGQKRKVPTPFDSLSDEFGEALNREIEDKVRASLSHLSDPQNSLQLRHGGSSEYQREDGSQHGSTFKQVSVTHELPSKDIASNDLSTLTAFIEAMSEGMSEGMTRNIYETVGAAAQSVGNTVSQAEAGSLAQVFIEALKKMEFCVGSDGKVSLPAFHAAPEIVEKMKADIEAQGPEFQQEIEQIKQQKIASAIEAEQNRRQRYKEPKQQ